MKVISVENVSKKFILAHDRPKNLADAARNILKQREREDFWAVKDVSFEVEQGEAIGIIGHNGAGKSTMLKLLTRIMQPTSGRIRTRGRVSALIEVGAGFHPEMTGRENIYLNGSILGMTRREIDRKFDEIVAFAELEKFIDTPVKRYSSGMYARLGFAVAAHVNPDMLIVDEVLAVGDLKFQSKCYAHMSELSKKGCSIVIVTHSLSAVSKTCKRVVWIEHGRTRSIGEPKSIIAAYQESMISAVGNMVGDGTRWGTGQARIADARLKSIIQHGVGNTSIIVEMDIEAIDLIESPVWWLMLSDAEDHKLLGSTHSHQQDLTHCSGNYYKILCQVNHIPFFPGDYKITLGIFDKNLLPIDRWGNALTIRIDAPDDTLGNSYNFDYHGVVCGNSEWKVN